MKINEKIKIFREMNALTQEEMANQLQLSLNGYANIERGETKLSLERLEQIANIFGMDITELLNFGENKSINFSYHTSNNNLNIIGESSNELFELEILRLQTTIGHKDELLGHKNELIEQLKAEVETLKLLVETLRNSK